MKRYIAILLTLYLLLSLAACTEQTPVATTVGTEVGTTSPAIEETNPVVATFPPVDPETWGSKNLLVATDGISIAPFYINFPIWNGSSEASGLMGNQGDGTMVIIDKQHQESPTVESLDKLFPTWFIQTEKIHEDYYGSHARNYKGTLLSSEPITIGEYDMQKFIGKMSFELFPSETFVEQSFVAYGTQLKENSCYVYWLVLDTSEDQSKGELVESHAYHMALTLTENEEW